MLTQQQIEQLLQSVSKHRTVTEEEIALLQRFLQQNMPDIVSIKKVKVVGEHADELCFTFEKDGESLSDQYFATIPKR